MEEIEKAIETRIMDYKTYGFGRWATILKSGKQFVGWAGLAYLPEFDEVDLGYRFLPEYWGLQRRPLKRQQCLPENQSRICWDNMSGFNSRIHVPDDSS